MQALPEEFFLETCTSINQTGWTLPGCHASRNIAALVARISFVLGRVCVAEVQPSRGIHELHLGLAIFCCHIPAVTDWVRIGMDPRIFPANHETHHGFRLARVERAVRRAKLKSIGSTSPDGPDQYSVGLRLSAANVMRRFRLMP